MGGRAMCLRCVFMTRHEYGADSSSEAAANDGIAEGTTPGALPGPEDPWVGWTPALAEDISPDILTCFGSSSACSKFAMLFQEERKTRDRGLPV